MKDAVSEVYKSKENLIIIGLTGRTGAGCSTVAKILSTSQFKDLDMEGDKNHSFENSDERKEHIIFEYMKEADRWQPFSVIEVSGLILASILEHSVEEFNNYVISITDEKKEKTISIGDKDKFLKKIEQMRYMFEDGKKYSLDPDRIDVSNLNESELKGYYEYYTKRIKEIKQQFRNAIDTYTCYENYDDKMKGKKQLKYHLYTYLMQQFGNNIRCSGDTYNNKFDEKKYHIFVKRIVKLIEIIRQYNEKIKKVEGTRICIDAIRNPYEAMFLKDEYRSFYLMAIKTEDKERKERLCELTLEELDNLDAIEYPQKMKLPQEVFYHQSIESCVEYAGIHVYNPNISNGKYFELTKQIVKYVSLILHPGLITPSQLERCMQLAYNTKFNSGCLSRQVGAVVTRADFSIQSVGWNDVPKGQVSCLLRDTEEYCQNKDDESFSKYEIEEKNFSNAIYKINNCTKEKLLGQCMSFCFKDVYNSITGDKNQVYTRALHAEENAFLQISKYGGTKVQDGYLFTTASPCELCAKKAYQLGIKKIYYINPYPGISIKHILSFGGKNNPEMYLFYGAIGQTFIDFYEPRIATKDELELLTDVNVKKLVSKSNKKENIQYSDIEYKNIEVDFEFLHTRSEIECTRNVEAIVKNENLKQITKKIIWTGSSYDVTELDRKKSDEDISLQEKKTELLYTYTLNFERKQNQELNYCVITKAKDEKNIMEPYLAHMVKNKTERLKLRVICEKEADILEDVKAKVYADLQMKLLIEEKNIEKKEVEDKNIYEFLVENGANVNYTYAIEWNFKKL